MEKLVTIDQMKKASYCFLLVASFTISCTKDDPPPIPIASFTYSVGSNGQVDFSNTSKNVTSYSWDFGDGSTSGLSTLENPNYKYNANGSFVVSLTATGPGGVVTVTNSIKINNVMGKIMFYSSTGFYCGPSINVKIGNSNSKTTEFASGKPNCGEAGYATFDLLAGDYTYSATCGDLSWSGNVSVGGGCSAYDFPAGFGMFFTEDADFGTITVDMMGQSRQIIQPNLSPSSLFCGDPFSALFILPPGIYTFHASSANGIYTWDGNITIPDNNGCQQVELK